MKKTLHAILIGFAISQSLSTAVAQTVTTGPSSSQSPYVLPILPGYTVTSVITVPNTVNAYTMCGIPDGMGAFDNNDGTFTLLMNHEIAVPGTNTGINRAHGQPGAFVSKWVINKSTLAVVSATDLIQNVNLWTGTTYTTYNAANTSTLATFSRFCSGDLPAASAYYNSYTGKGTQERIYMNGEESGDEGRIMAHIATGPNAGTSYQLPYLGRFSCENQVANPRRSDKTIVAGFDDTSPLGQVYVYVGSKSTTGTEIAKAGLTGGNLYGIAVAGMLNETAASFPAANTTFSMVNLGQVQAITGASLDAMSTNMGVTKFLRPEDGAWDPSNPNDLYFNTTDAFNSPSRLWKAHFTDLDNPQLGGTITAVLDGTEGQQMLDNMTIDNSGHILLCEDVGNNVYLGRLLEYNIATDVLIPIAQHDATRFLSTGANYLTQDEETSGVLDAQAILGPGMFLFVCQAHYTITGAPVEGGQLMTLKSANTASSNPEIDVQGNATSIPAGNTAISTTNNTDYGNVTIGSGAQTKTFVIQNTGTGQLHVSGIDITGFNASNFTLVSPPAFPWNIAANAAQTITVQFMPAAAGIYNAAININNNDLNENLYNYSVQALVSAPTNTSTVGIKELPANGSFVNLYPNPTKDEAIVSISLEKREHVVISIFDLLGKEVGTAMAKDLNSGDNQVILNTSEFKNGVYFVQINAAEKTSKIKMIVKH